MAVPTFVNPEVKYRDDARSLNPTELRSVLPVPRRMVIREPELHSLSAALADTALDRVAAVAMRIAAALTIIFLDLDVFRMLLCIMRSPRNMDVCSLRSSSRVRLDEHAPN